MRPPAFGAVPRCVVPPVLLCVSHLHRACGSTWCFSVSAWWFFWGSCVIFFSLPVVVPCFLWSRLVFCCCWCGVLVLWSAGRLVCIYILLVGVRCCVALSEILVVASCWCWFVYCLVVLLFLSVLVLVCFGWSAVLVAVVLPPLLCCSWSSCWLLVRVWFVFWFVVVVLLCPLFCSWWCCWCGSPVRCTVLVLVAPGWFMRLVVVLLVVGLLVLLSPLFLVRHDQRVFAPAPGLMQNATLVGWLCGVSASGGYGSLSRCAVM